MTTRIGYIGLGNMGAPMARRLLDHNGGLSVLDTNPDALAPFIEAGAHSVSNAAALASVSDIVCVTVLDDAQVRDVVAGPDGLLSTATPGTVIAVHSTISDTTAVDLAEQCTQRDIPHSNPTIPGFRSSRRFAALGERIWRSHWRSATDSTSNFPSQHAPSPASDPASESESATPHARRAWRKHLRLPP